MKTNASVGAFVAEEWINSDLSYADWVSNKEDRSIDIVTEIMSIELRDFLVEIRRRLRYQVEFSIHRKTGSRGTVVSVKPPNSNLITALVSTYDDGGAPQRVHYEVFSPRIERSKRLWTNINKHCSCASRTTDMNKAAKLVASFAPVSDAELALVSIKSIKNTADVLLGKPRAALRRLAHDLFVSRLRDTEKQELLLALERADKDQTPVSLDDCRYLMDHFHKYKEERDKQVDKVGYIGEQKSLYVVQTYLTSDVMVIGEAGGLYYCTRYTNVDALPRELLRPLKTLDVESTRPELDQSSVELEGIGYFPNSERKRWVTSRNPFSVPIYAIFVDSDIYSTALENGEPMSDAV
tara:strand:+ start:41 stop:1096 length:1056 start_codon:yes stop_codon:yes gene_type:complete